MIEEGQTVTVELPDERTRAEILSVVSASAFIGRISQFTTASKSHSYKKGDTIAVQQRPGAFGQTVWQAVPESELFQPEAIKGPSVPEMTEGDLYVGVDGEPVSKTAQSKPRAKTGREGVKDRKRDAQSRKSGGSGDSDGKRQGRRSSRA